MKRAPEETRQTPNQSRPAELVAAGRPHDRSRFLNCRAEVYWDLREAFEKGEVDIDALDDELAAQLGGISREP